MILPDANVWIALIVSGHGHHQQVAAWLDTIQEPGTVRFCRETQRATLRLLTTSAVHAPLGDPPLSNAQAWAVYESSLSDDRIGPLAPEPRGIEPTWQRLSSRNTASPKMWMDSYLAAFAIAGGMTLVTIDKAFRQFDGLDLHLIG